MYPIMFRAGILISMAMPMAAVAQSPTVAIVFVKGKGAPELKAPVNKHIVTGIKAEAAVVDQKAYLARAKKAGINKATALRFDSATEAGKAAGATHVLFIESQTQKEKGKKKSYIVDVKLLDVTAGVTIHTHQYALEGQKLTAEIGVEIIAAVLSAATAPPEAPEPVAEEPEDLSATNANETITDEGTAGEITGGETIELTPVADATSPVTAESEGGDTTATSSATEISAISKPEEIGPPAVVPEVSVPVKSEPERSHWRPALRLDVGAMFLYRHARIMTRGSGPIVYEWPMSGGYGMAEFYPLVLSGSGRWYEGFGIHFEGELLYAKTDKWGWSTNDPEREVESGVGGPKGGLSYRLALGDSATAPDFTFKAGYGAFIFPLKEGAFPGSRYHAPYVGGALSLPLADSVGMLVGGNASPIVSTAGRLQRMGANESAHAFELEAGIRIIIEPIEILAIGRFAQYRSTYAGQTTLDDSEDQYANVTLTDRLFGGFVAIGLIL